jgi:transposase
MPMIHIGCDAHKRYSMFAAVNSDGQLVRSTRVEHVTALYRDFLSGLPVGTPIAIETVGNWYWMIKEIEGAGHRPILVHAAKAKLMMGQINKTDKLDAKALAVMLRNGTLPSVWIPPAELRDQRELPRMRMSMVRMRTTLKNRIHATLAKYMITIDEVSDIFGKKGRAELEKQVATLPPHTRQSVSEELELLDEVEGHIQNCEGRIREIVKSTPEMELLKTIPGVGPILAIVIAWEVGDVSRFPGPEHLASYAGTVPRVHSSGGRTTFGRVRPDVNRYLKWALVEAANVNVLNRKRRTGSRLVGIYERIRERKGHAKAVVAVARNIAEAVYWILTRKEPYKEPQRPTSSSQE